MKHIDPTVLRDRILATGADWFKSLSKKQQKEYIKEHPRSKYAKQDYSFKLKRAAPKPAPAKETPARKPSKAASKVFSEIEQRSMDWTPPKKDPKKPHASLHNLLTEANKARQGLLSVEEVKKHASNRGVLRQMNPRDKVDGVHDRDDLVKENEELEKLPQVKKYLELLKVQTDAYNDLEDSIERAAKKSPEVEKLRTSRANILRLMKITPRGAKWFDLKKQADGVHQKLVDLLDSQ